MFKHLLLDGGRFAAGVVIKKFLEFLFDYGLYPASLVFFGYVWGGIIMTVATIIINLIIILLYDWAETDWLFIEKLKHIREDDKVKLPRLISWMTPLLKKGDITAFFVLCADDPVIATLYLRKGAYQYNGLSKRDWKIFAAANVVSNVYWIVGLAGIIEVYRAIMHI